MRLLERAQQDEMTFEICYNAGFVRPYGESEFHKDKTQEGYGVTVDDLSFADETGNELLHQNLKDLANAAEKLYEEALKRR
ncbi:hypothetical protein JXA63_04035 [Candidatus Woesebacteria bacterium]|nr:hypothetical protein [Candidatus Woesebacteria bacterium]